MPHVTQTQKIYKKKKKSTKRGILMSTTGATHQMLLEKLQSNLISSRF